MEPRCEELPMGHVRGVGRLHRGVAGCGSGGLAAAGGGGAMSRSMRFGGRASAPVRAISSLLPLGTRAENGLTPGRAGAPGTNGLPTVASIATGRATGSPDLSISTTFCAKGCGFGGGTSRATTGRSVLPRGIALGLGLALGATARLARVGTAPTAV